MNASSRRPASPPGRTIWYLMLALGLFPLVAVVVIPSLWRGRRRSAQRTWATVVLVALVADQLVYLAGLGGVLSGTAWPLALILITLTAAAIIHNASLASARG